MGDRLGIPGAVDFFLFCLSVFRTRLVVKSLCFYLSPAWMLLLLLACSCSIFVPLSLPELLNARSLDFQVGKPPIVFCFQKGMRNWIIPCIFMESWFHGSLMSNATVTFCLTIYLDECMESRRKIGHYIFRVSFLKASYKGVRLDVLKKLFSHFCTSFSGSQAWNLCHACVNSIQKAFNTAVGMLLN